MTDRPNAPAAGSDRPAPSVADKTSLPFEETADRRTQAPIVPVEQKPGEVGGSDKPEPTRYGDWEVGGRCSDF